MEQISTINIHCVYRDQYFLIYIHYVYRDNLSLKVVFLFQSFHCNDLNQRNWVFATNSDFLILVSFQPAVFYRPLIFNLTLFDLKDIWADIEDLIYFHHVHRDKYYLSYIHNFYMDQFSLSYLFFKFTWCQIMIKTYLLTSDFFMQI